MIIYKDVISDDELFSDSYPIKDINGIMIEVEGRMITVTEGGYDIGANPSAEGEDEPVDDASSRQVVDIVDAHKLEEQQGFQKKEYLTQLKGYMKRLKEHLQNTNPDRVAEFQAKSSEMAKKIVSSFDDYRFFIGQSFNFDGMIIIMGYREDGMTPYFLFWKDGLKEEKY